MHLEQDASWVNGPHCLNLAFHDVHVFSLLFLRLPLSVFLPWQPALPREQLGGPQLNMSKVVQQVKGTWSQHHCSLRQ